MVVSLDDTDSAFFRNQPPLRSRTLDSEGIPQAVCSDSNLRRWIREDLQRTIRDELQVGLQHFKKELWCMLRDESYFPHSSDGKFSAHAYYKSSEPSEAVGLSTGFTDLMISDTTPRNENGFNGKSGSISDIQRVDKLRDPAPSSEFGSGDETPPGAESRSLQEKLFKAVEDGNESEIISMLEERADPNSKMKHYRLKNKKFNDCSLLSVAVLSDQVKLVNMLVERRSDINATYGFTAGSINMEWIGQCQFWPIVKGNLEFLKDLIYLKADPHALASNHASLVWQACYFGKNVEMLRYLVVDLEVNCDIAGQSQDIAGVTFTPLHLATLQGHLSHVEMLLSCGDHCKNTLNLPNEEHSTPLSDAIRFVLPSIVRVLVSHGAHFVEHKREGGGTQITTAIKMQEFKHGSSAGASKSSLSTDNSLQSPLQLLFKERNPVLVHAVAEGLKKQDSQVMALDTDNVRQFLQTADSAGRRAILKAIFKERDLVYRGKRYEKIPLTTAMLKKTRKVSEIISLISLNVVESAWRYTDLQSRFTKRLQPEGEMKAFMDALLPRKATHWRFREKHYQMTSVVVCESIIPDFHRDLRILREIKNVSSFDKFLSTTECRAVIESNWLAQKLNVWIETFFHFSLLCVYMGIVTDLHLNQVCETQDTQCETGDNKDIFRWLALIGFPLVLLELLLEVFEFITHAVYGWRMEYLLDTRNHADWFRIGLDMLILLIFISSDNEEAHSYRCRVLFSLCCFVRWHKMLYCLTPFRRVGLHIMPIQSSLHDIGPFILFFFFYCFGLGHAYFAMHFNLQEANWSFLEVMYFGMIPEEYVIPTVELPSSHENLEERFISKVMLLMATFFLPIALMNILIAAMNNSYSRGVANMERLYQSRLAHCVFNHKASAYGAYRLFRVCRRREQRLEEKQYLWYCYERDDKPKLDYVDGFLEKIIKKVDAKD